MLGRSEAEGDHDNTGIDEEADQNAGGDDFHVRNFVLVQVPRSSDTEKFSAVPITIYHENDKIYYLEKKNNWSHKDYIYLVVVYIEGESNSWRLTGVFFKVLLLCQRL